MRVNEEGLIAIKKRDYVATVARALGPQFKHVEYGVKYSTDKGLENLPGGGPLRHDAIQTRYERACREGDMVDFAPWLREHAKGQVLEIGTRDGGSTSAILLGLEDRGGHLTSVDIQDCSSLWSHPKWTFIRGNSLDLSFQKIFHDGQFDFALIDGGHDLSVYIGDLYNCYHWVQSGGMILSHDVTPERGHEFYAVQLREEFFKFAKEKNLQHYILPGKYGLGVMIKA